MVLNAQRAMEVGKEGGYIYLSLHCHHQNDSCIKMGSDESRFNVSLTVMDKVTGQCPQTTIFLKRKENRSRIDPRPFGLLYYLPNALPLGQTGSRGEGGGCGGGGGGARGV